MAFFGDGSSDFEMAETNYPQDTLIYINQAYVTVVKGGNILYAGHFILGQIIPATNVPEDIESYKYGNKENKIIRSLYDVKTREFKGMKRTIGLIIVRGDEEEVFFDYGFNKAKPKVLYINQKRQISNMLSETVVNKHKGEILNEKKKTFSKLLFFLTLTTDRKQEINQHLSNVSFHRIDFSYDDFQKLYPSNSTFVPSDLKFGGERRKAVREIVVEFLKECGLEVFLKWMSNQMLSG